MNLWVLVITFILSFVNGIEKDETISLKSLDKYEIIIVNNDENKETCKLLRNINFETPINIREIEPNDLSKFEEIYKSQTNFTDKIILLRNENEILNAFNEEFKNEITYILKFFDENHIQLKFLEINTAKELQSILLNTKKSVYLFLGDRNYHENEFNQIIKVFNKNHQNHIFLYTNSVELKNEYEIKSDSFDVVYYKYSQKIKFHKSWNYMELMDIPLENEGFLTSFQEISIRNPILTFNQQIYEKFSNYNYPTLFLIYNPIQDNYDKVLELAISIKKTFHKLFQYIIVEYDDHLFKKLMIDFKIENFSTSALIIDKSNPNILNHYSLNNGILIYSDIVNFIDDYKNKASLKNYFVSEMVPEKPQNIDGVYKIVGRSFSEFKSISGKKDLFILFYSRNNLNTIELLKRYNNISKLLKEFSNTLILGEFDTKKNEISELKLENIPSLIYYSFSNSTGNYEKVFFKDIFKTKNIINFISQNVRFSKLDSLLNQSVFETSDNEIEIPIEIDVRSKNSELDDDDEEKEENDSIADIRFKDLVNSVDMSLPLEELAKTDLSDSIESLLNENDPAELDQDETKQELLDKFEVRQNLTIKDKIRNILKDEL